MELRYMGPLVNMWLNLHIIIFQLTQVLFFQLIGSQFIPTVLF